MRRLRDVILAAGLALGVIAFDLAARAQTLEERVACLELGTPCPPAEPVPTFTWDESATWSSYNATLALTWATKGGDVGEKVAELVLVDDNAAGWESVAVPAGGDFIVKRSGGTNFTFSSREGANPPQLVLADGRVLNPIADCTLTSSSSASQCAAKSLSTAGGFLIRFPTAEAGTLRLYSTGAEYGHQTLILSRLGIKPASAAVPAWLVDDGTVVATFTGADMAGEPLAKVAGTIATATMPYPELTWMSRVKAIPPLERGCLTVYVKLGADFTPGDGGKLPGLSNTGIATNDAVKTAWGGREPDGVHWSARTGFGGWTADHAALRSYFYAMAPHDSFGHVQSTNAPLPKGRWTAYVECVKLNSVTPGAAQGNADGGLFYEALGYGPTLVRSDIRWRDQAVPASLIREAWLDFYCGGTKCGSGPRGTISFAGAVVTRGRPDMRAVAAEVRRLRGLDK